jgi:hypothetical protein
MLKKEIIQKKMVYAIKMLLFINTADTGHTKELKFSIRIGIQDFLITEGGYIFQSIIYTGIIGEINMCF